MNHKQPEKIVVCDSQYGNTEKIAAVVAEAIGAKLFRAGQTKPSDLEGCGLLVVGSPTQGGMATQAIREFIDEIPDNIVKNLKVAVFDTRFLEKDLNFALKLLVRTIGYAAPKIAKQLEAKGAILSADPEGFIVKGKDGPLAEGELDRAKNWLKI